MNEMILKEFTKNLLNLTITILILAHSHRRDYIDLTIRKLIALTLKEYIATNLLNNIENVKFNRKLYNYLGNNIRKEKGIRIIS